MRNACMIMQIHVTISNRWMDGVKGVKNCIAYGLLPGLLISNSSNDTLKGLMIHPVLTN